MLILLLIAELIFIPLLIIGIIRKLIKLALWSTIIVTGATVLLLL